MKIRVRTLAAYQRWFSEQPAKFRAQVETRLTRIIEHGHFGDAKPLREGLAELKFNNGCRVYFKKISETEIVLITGGNKNGQSKDIQKALKLFP